MEKNIFATEFKRELEEEVVATRKCLERMSEDLFDWKPHDKSMLMGNLAMITAEVPKWISMTIEKNEIDFANWERYKLTTVKDLLRYFDKNVELAKQSLEGASDKAMEEMFYLKMKGKELMKSSKKESISSSIRHWVHHRGQLTVYMRLNDMLVPSIYGPSADEKDSSWS